MFDIGGGGEYKPDPGRPGGNPSGGKISVPSKTFLHFDLSSSATALFAGPHGKIYIVDLLQRPHIPKLHVSVLLMLCSPTQFTLECNGRRRILITW